MKEQEGVYDLDGGVEKALGHRCLLVPGCQPLYPLNRTQEINQSERHRRIECIVGRTSFGRGWRVRSRVSLGDGNMHLDDRVRPCDTIPVQFGDSLTPIPNRAVVDRDIWMSTCKGG